MYQPAAGLAFAYPLPVPSWEAGLADTGTFLSGVAACVLAVTGAITAWSALRTYRKQALEKRGRWLTDLQNQFAGRHAFQQVRLETYNDEDSKLIQALERWNTPKMSRSRPRTLTTKERDLLVSLDDYLEFLGLIKRLIDSKELRAEDAYTMFNWYAIEGVSNPAIARHIRQHFGLVGELQDLFLAIRRSGTRSVREGAWNAPS